MTHISEFAVLTVSGLLVNLLGTVFAVWWSHRGLKRHADAVTRLQTGAITDLTDRQTTHIKAITDQQTDTLLGRRGPLRRSKRRAST